MFVPKATHPGVGEDNELLISGEVNGKARNVTIRGDKVASLNKRYEEVASRLVVIQGKQHEAKKKVVSDFEDNLKLLQLKKDTALKEVDETAQQEEKVVLEARGELDSQAFSLAIDTFNEQNPE